MLQLQHFSSVLLLGLITSSTSLTNHPKWKQIEHSDGQNFQLSSCFTLWTVNWLKS